MLRSLQKGISRHFSSSLLTNIRVLDLSRIIVGPYATMILSDFGAEVTKVEHPEGDETRKWGPPWKNGASCYFISINRNKKSITLDLKKPQGQEIIYKLTKQSDVLVENFIPGTTERLKVSFSDIVQVNPKIVYCSISGYGDTGPKAHHPAFDQVVQGQSGFMHLTGGTDTSPYKMGFAIADVLAGLYSANAILAGLQYVRDHGKGIHVKNSLLESSIASLINQASNYLNGGKNPSRMGNNHPNIVPYGVFPCADGHITIAGGSDKQYEAICDTLNLPHKPEYSTNKARVEKRNEVNQMLSQQTSKWKVKDLLEGLQKRKVPCGAINSLDSLFKDEQVQHLNMVSTVTHNQSEYKLLRSPIRTNQDNIAEPTPPPTLSQHTSQILAGLGYTESQIASFKASKVI